MTIQGSTIQPSPTHHFLGVILDQELRWKAQVDNAIMRGTAYVLQLHHLSSAAKGIPLQLMHQLYQAVAVPKMLYAVDLCFSLVHQEGTDKLQHSSIRVAKKISMVQHIATIAITGAMRSTAMDLLESHYPPHNLPKDAPPWNPVREMTRNTKQIGQR
ncbi:hypothetical protein BDR04DRAFT_1167518 [Suillus decipiens]|nr:hypothetical protein BDR04DRAFT_1167518 [Suillus decipiens]